MNNINFLLFLCLLIFIFSPVIILANQIDINSATLKELEQITGIGPKYAQLIIDNRPYSSINDLLKIKGIGGKTLQKIKDQGLACVNCLNIIGIEKENKTITETQNITNIYADGVFINEILPNPDGPDETEEWIELYNSNNFEVDLSNWQIKDTVGIIKIFKIPNETKISANGFLVFKRLDTKIMLNNDGDGLILMHPNNKIADSINFLKAPLKQSYNKKSSEWFWSTSLTPGAKNIISLPNKQNLPKTQKTDNNIVDGPLFLNEDLTADLNQNQDFKTNNPWFLFFTVLTATLILAVIVLLIKFKFLNKNNVRT